MGLQSRHRVLRSHPLLIATIIPALLLTFALYVALNCPISPVPLPLPSCFSNNNFLQGLEKLGDGLLQGPEDICFDKNGTLYAPTRDGWIKRKLAGNETWEDWKCVGGNGALGLAPSKHGGVIVCDANKGLLRVGEEGVTILASEVDGKKINLADDIIEASDGTVYFSDASSKFGFDNWFLDVLEARPHGRLLKYDPITKNVSVVLEDLAFANGVALSPLEDYLIICETWKFRCLKHWLDNRENRTEIFIDNLPGGPDNINRAPDGSYWIALLQLRSTILDLFHGWSEAKCVIATSPKLVELLNPTHTRATVINVGEDGKIKMWLDDSEGKVISMVTSAVERDGHLYLGNLGVDFVGKYALPGASSL